jgi:hypothetical protein
MHAHEIGEAQNFRHKKTFSFCFAFLVFSGKFGEQSLRFRPAITFYFGITVFFAPEQKSDGSYDPWTTMLCFPEEKPQKVPTAQRF